MNDHDKIRELLALSVADALTRAEEEQVMNHAHSCAECSSELDSWRLLAERNGKRNDAPVIKKLRCT